MCLCCIFFLGRLQLHVCDNLLSFSLALASPHPAGNTQPWVWNVFTFWVCYKLSAKTNLRDLAEAFTLLRCCLGQTFFYRVPLSFWLSLSDKGFPSQMWTQEKVKTHYADVCLWACTHVLIWVYAWTCGVGTLPTCPQYFSQLGRIHLFIIQQKTRGNCLNNLTTLMYF